VGNPDGKRIFPCYEQRQNASAVLSISKELPWPELVTGSMPGKACLWCPPCSAHPAGAVFRLTADGTGIIPTFNYN